MKKALMGYIHHNNREEYEEFVWNLMNILKRLESKDYIYCTMNEKNEILLKFFSSENSQFLPRFLDNDFELQSFYLYERGDNIFEFEIKTQSKYMGVFRMQERCYFVTSQKNQQFLNQKLLNLLS